MYQQFYKKMNLKEYLISIGRYKDKNGSNKEEAIKPIPGNEADYQTIGDIFDYYKRLGYKKLPENSSINAPGWKSQKNKLMKFDLN